MEIKLSSKVPERVTLIGKTVIIEPLDPLKHGDDLYKNVCGPEFDELWTWLPCGPFTTRDSFDEYLRQNAASKDPLYFAIISNESNECVGHISFLNIMPQDNVVEVGWVLFSAKMQRTLMGTETNYLLARYVFEELKWRRYEWKANALNQKSRAAAERFGFVFEGIFRNHKVVKDKNRDTIWFAMTDEDWRRVVKPSVEAYLSDDNFENGVQKRSLSSFRIALT